MPQPILFTVAKIRSAQGVPVVWGDLPMPGAPSGLHISGITKDSTGVVLGSCTVKLFRTVDDLLMETVTSDAVTGAYSFASVGLSETYYVVAYKAGSPDVAGTTVNTLVGA